jgi:hypothetical protein
MDVIASGVEACPWGLTGYGFDPYIATSPGNAVLAIARFWADHAKATLDTEKRFPDRCLRVRYEDLVTDTEETAARIFAFLAAAPAAGISKACFSGERERFGPADYKIWYTSAISDHSIGRGWSVPAAMIAPPVLTQVNDLAGELGYLAIDDEWGTSAPPADVRASPGAPAAVTDSLTPVISKSVGHRLEAGMAAPLPGDAERFGSLGGETMVAVCVAANPRQPSEHWLVDFGSRTVRYANRDAQENSDWDIIGSVEAWEDVIAGKQNLSVALRSYQLRYCDRDESGPVAAESRLRVLADLLGLANW